MVNCPVCGGEITPGKTACELCGLPTELAEIIRDAPELPPGPIVSPPAPKETAPPTALPLAELAEPSGAPASPGAGPGGQETGAEEAPRPAASPTSRPSDGPPGALGEALRIGRVLGMDLSELETDLASARSEQSSARFSRIRRELVRSVLDVLMDRYRWLCDRRDALSPVVRTHALDAELVSYRRALSAGKLRQAAEHRATAEAMVDSTEASWARIRDQFTEAGKMIEALRELGGVAPGVLRPVAEAIRIPRKGEAEQIEQRLKKAHDLLWGLLVPRMNYELSKGRSLLDDAETSTARTNLIRREIDRVADEIRAQKVREALESRRFLRLELASITPKAPRSSVRRSFIE
jgi:hypothetical protein